MYIYTASLYSFLNYLYYFVFILLHAKDHICVLTELYFKVSNIKIAVCQQHGGFSPTWCSKSPRKLNPRPKIKLLF